MIVNIRIESLEQMQSLEVVEDLECENFKVYLEVETGIPSLEMELFFKNKSLINEGKKTLKEIGVVHGDTICVKLHQIPGATSFLGPSSSSSSLLSTSSSLSSVIPKLDFSQIKIPSVVNRVESGQKEDDPSWIRDMLRANPEQMAILKQNNPRLADALDSGNLEEFAKILKEQQTARANREQQRIRLLTADPFDTEAQKLIAQEIENKNIEQNMELAMEYNPESFGTVVMLYINCIVNGHHIKAFVDSGAQATIMSQATAERCNIMRLVDRRWAGIAKGVGTQKILGRVHMVQIQINNDFLTSSFSILENQPMDMLLGLDMLKRHQCVIDLKTNMLIIGSTGTETPFLSESELPECSRLSGPPSRDETSFDYEEMSKKSGTESKRLKSDESICSTDTFTEENVQTLIDYGFERNKCIRELREHKGDMAQATAALFDKSLHF